MLLHQFVVQFIGHHQGERGPDTLSNEVVDLVENLVIGEGRECAVEAEIHLDDGTYIAAVHGRRHRFESVAKLVDCRSLVRTLHDLLHDKTLECEAGGKDVLGRLKRERANSISAPGAVVDESALAELAKCLPYRNAARAKLLR